MIDLKSKQEKQLLEAIELFYYAYRAFTSGPDRILAEHSLSRVHHRLLYFIARNPGINVNELLSILEVSKQALNGPLRSLVEMELVSNDSAEHDRRVRELKLSKKGAELERQLTNTQMQLLKKVFHDAGSQSEKGWREIMDKIPQ